MDLTIEEIEKVDEVTNEIMDGLREKFKINSNSNLDDELYHFIWCKIKDFRTAV